MFQLRSKPGGVLTGVSILPRTQAPLSWTWARKGGREGERKRDVLIHLVKGKLYFFRKTDFNNITGFDNLKQVSSRKSNTPLWLKERKQGTFWISFSRPDHDRSVVQYTFIHKSSNDSSSTSSSYESSHISSSTLVAAISAELSRISKH